MRAPLLATILNPINLAMLALTFAAGLCSAWWLFPVGLLLWGMMLVIVARDPALRLQQQVEARQPLAQRFQPYFDRVEGGQLSIYRTIKDAKPAQQTALEPIQAATAKLVDDVYRFCQRMTVMENHRLVTQRTGNLTDKIAEMEYRVQNTTDADVRREYEESLAALQKRKASLAGLAKELDRAEAQLTSITSDVANLFTDVIRLQAADPKQIRGEVPSLVQTIEQERADLARFEQEVRNL
jgi:chromosome segregation ATPase